MFTCVLKPDDSCCLIAIGGKVDSANAQELANSIEALENGKPVMLDLSDLLYISSAGLRVILKLRKKYDSLELRNLIPDVYDIFEMTGFTQMMKVSRAYKQISVEGCELIGRGSNGEVYRIDPDTVVKVYRNADALPVIEHERDVARKALVLGIPTAISYDVVKVGDNYASMFEMLNARSFSNLLSSGEDNLESCAKMYTDLMKTIHSTRVPAGQLPNQKEVTVEWVHFLKDYLPEETYSKLEKLVDAIPETDTMIHGDFHTKNLMLQNDEVLLIDMDTLAVGHPVLEMASVYNAYLGFHLLEHDTIKDFLGIEYDTAVAFYNRVLQLYYNTTDKDMLAIHSDRAKLIGLVRIMRRCIKRKTSPELQAACKDEIIRLAGRLDSLV